MILEFKQDTSTCGYIVNNSIIFPVLFKGFVQFCAIRKDILLHVRPQSSFEGLQQYKLNNRNIKKLFGYQLTNHPWLQTAGFLPKTLDLSRSKEQSG